MSPGGRQDPFTWSGTLCLSMGWGQPQPLAPPALGQLSQSLGFQGVRGGRGQGILSQGWHSKVGALCPVLILTGLQEQLLLTPSEVKP